MNGDLDKQDNLLDTTDCLEAVSVFRGWKNFLFVITFCCLLVLQAAFLIGWAAADIGNTGRKFIEGTRDA